MRGCCSGTGAYPNITAGVKAGWIAGAAVGVLWAGFCCWLLCLPGPPDALVVSLPKALKVFVWSAGSWGSVLVMFSAAFLIFGGLATVRPAALSKRRTTGQVIILSLSLVGAISTGYLVWAKCRIGDCTTYDAETMPWPYPDSLLFYFHNWLDARNPVPPGIIKWHGELDRLHLILGFAVAASALLTSVCLLPFVIPRPRLG